MPVLAWNFTVFNRALSFFSTLIRRERAASPVHVPSTLPTWLLRQPKAPLGGGKWELLPREGQMWSCPPRVWAAAGGAKPAFPTGTGTDSRLALQTWRQQQPAPLLSVTSHLTVGPGSRAGHTDRGHKEQPLLSHRDPDWLTPTPHAHRHHRGG